MKYYNNLDKKIFENKSKLCAISISIIDNEILITDEMAVAKKINVLFIKAVKNHDIKT